MVKYKARLKVYVLSSSERGPKMMLHAGIPSLPSTTPGHNKHYTCARRDRYATLPYPTSYTTSCDARAFRAAPSTLLAYTTPSSLRAVARK